VTETPRVAIVAPAFNEGENVGPLVAEITRAFAVLGDYEVILVDDKSTDDTAARVLALAAADPRIRLIQHDRQSGQSFAVANGVRAARAPWIVTLDGDLQNNPADLVEMINIAWASPGRAPLVAGIRQKRQDSPARLWASKVANNLRGWLLKDDCPDTACGMKAFRREDFMRLPVFNGLHRFIPALMQAYGVPLINHPVSHRPRTAGVSKYTNWKRGLMGVRDLLGVLWLQARIRNPTASEVLPPK
jgi:dolichol-phosphate mannosyltransferase